MGISQCLCPFLMSLIIKQSHPERDEVLEAQVRKELRSIDELLDIKWIPNIHFNAKAETYEGRYVLVVGWPSTDKRRSSGKTPEEQRYDILGFFCTDIDNGNSVPVSPDQMMPLIYERLANADGDRLPHTKRMAQVIARNDARYAQVKKDTVDEAVQEALHERNRILKIQQVNVPVQLEN